MLLTSCAETKLVKEVHSFAQRVPASLLTCDPAPIPPEVTSQRDVARYIIDLWDAHGDCQAKLREVSGLVETE